MAVFIGATDRRTKYRRSAGVYYLNNSGSRWIVIDEDGKKEQKYFDTKSGKKVLKTILEYQSFGNFASAVISHKGKKINVLMDTVLPD